MLGPAAAVELGRGAGMAQGDALDVGPGPVEGEGEGLGRRTPPISSSKWCMSAGVGPAGGSVTCR